MSHLGISVLCPSAWSMLTSPFPVHPRMPGHGLPVDPPFKACLRGLTCRRDAGSPGLGKALVIGSQSPMERAQQDRASGFLPLPLCWEQ